jgi:hypothetical protein
MNPDDINDRVALLLGRAIIRAESLQVERDRLHGRLAQLEHDHANQNGKQQVAR